MNIADLNSFIVRAKGNTYVGNGVSAPPSRNASRAASHDLVFEDGDWSYRDSYFGGTDFLGQETVWLRGEPTWAMNYYGYVLRPDLIDSDRAGETIMGALSAMYTEGRFLGGFEWDGPHGRYVDTSSGDVVHFHGRETITVDATIAYALDYFGGLIKP
jgi:hypothetical protein